MTAISQKPFIYKQIPVWSLKTSSALPAKKNPEATLWAVIISLFWTLQGPDAKGSSCGLLIHAKWPRRSFFSKHRLADRAALWMASGSDCQKLGTISFHIQINQRSPRMRIQLRTLCGGIYCVLWTYQRKITTMFVSGSKAFIGKSRGACREECGFLMQVLFSVAN